MNRKNAIKKFIKALTGVEPEGKTFSDIFSNGADDAENNRVDIIKKTNGTLSLNLDWATFANKYNTGILTLGQFIEIGPPPMYNASMIGQIVSISHVVLDIMADYSKPFVFTVVIDGAFVKYNYYHLSETLELVEDDVTNNRIDFDVSDPLNVVATMTYEEALGKFEAGTLILGNYNGVDDGSQVFGAITNVKYFTSGDYAQSLVFFAALMNSQVAIIYNADGCTVAA